MNLFRSEEHVSHWAGDRTSGTTIGVRKLCELAHAWWSDRLDLDWAPRTRDANQAILDRLGLTGPAWRLP